MHYAKKLTCRVIEKIWLTPTVMQLKFTAMKPIDFTAGQFISLYIPPYEGLNRKMVRRAYSFSLPPNGSYYELCVKYVPGGPGTEYLRRLMPGDTFEATAPYGDFFYKARPGRSVCFIATGTGIAPLRAMVLSREFQDNPPEKSLLIFGARMAKEIIYPGYFEKLGIEVVNSLSRVTAPGPGVFKGRLTEYLHSLPVDWPWHKTDFYICGNGDMITEVCRIIQGGHGVPDSAIFHEAYFSKLAPESINPFGDRPSRSAA